MWFVFRIINRDPRYCPSLVLLPVWLALKPLNQRAIQLSSYFNLPIRHDWLWSRPLVFENGRANTCHHHADSITQFVSGDWLQGVFGDEKEQDRPEILKSRSPFNCNASRFAPWCPIQRSPQLVLGLRTHYLVVFASSPVQLAIDTIFE